MKIKTISRGLMAYGPLLVCGLYLTWGLARLSLGYWPRPSLDDPKDIAWIGLPHLATMLLFIAWPLAAISGIAAAAYSWRVKDPEKKKRALEVLIGLVTLGACVWFVHKDPWRVTLWFMD